MRLLPPTTVSAVVLAGCCLLASQGLYAQALRDTLRAGVARQVRWCHAGASDRLCSQTHQERIVREGGRVIVREIASPSQVGSPFWLRLLPALQPEQWLDTAWLQALCGGLPPMGDSLVIDHPPGLPQAQRAVLRRSLADGYLQIELYLRGELRPWYRRDRAWEGRICVRTDAKAAPPDTLAPGAQLPRIQLAELVQGGVWESRRRPLYWRFDPLWKYAGFTPVDGFFVEDGMSCTWQRPQAREIELGYRLRYAFARREPAFQLRAAYSRLLPTRWAVQAEGGRFIAQFSPFPQIDLHGNSLSTLLFRQNLTRLYERNYLSAQASVEPRNGLLLQACMSTELRYELPNVSDFALSGGTYQENFALEMHRAHIATLHLRWQPRNSYLLQPRRKIDLGSPWPELSLTYTQAFALGPASSAFAKVEFAARSHHLRYDTPPPLRWRLRAGAFLFARGVHLPDYFHFKGNQTFFHSGAFGEYYLLPYYQPATVRPFLEAHAEYRLPVGLGPVRTFVGAHGLWQQGQTAYLEAHLGMEWKALHLFPLRLDLAFRPLSPWEGRRWGALLTSTPPSLPGWP
ncbi:MAG: hypothetical protein OHK0039_32350 [Bacteroidia bacterium]